MANPNPETLKAIFKALASGRTASGLVVTAMTLDDGFDAPALAVTNPNDDDCGPVLMYWLDTGTTEWTDESGIEMEDDEVPEWAFAAHELLRAMGN